LNRKFGPGELGKIVSGKYHTPREENRIFLFLDMKSSTTIAEKLGNLTYSKFIRQCFIDLSDIIMKYEATIYQHAGDEIVLTWANEKALRQLKPIYLFFEFQDKLKNRAKYYYNKFGVLPEFKAAIHMGLVVVAETSDLKREIAFHGDVMNTTARLEKQCNKYEEKLLISESVKNTITHLNGYTFNYLGEILLKGKKSFLKIYSVKKMI
jgi:adenylate cyclase